MIKYTVLHLKQQPIFLLQNPFIVNPNPTCNYKNSTRNNFTQPDTNLPQRKKKSSTKNGNWVGLN